MAGSRMGFAAQLARLRDAAARARSYFDRRVADPVIARVAPKADANTKLALRTGLFAFAVLLCGAAVGGAGWILFAPNERVVIVIADIAGDRHGAWHARVRTAILKVLGSSATVRDADETLPREGDIVDKDGERARDAQAQAIIQRDGAAELIWGEVSPSGGSAQLFYLPWDGTTRTSNAHRYLRKTALKVDAVPDAGIDDVIALYAITDAHGRKGQSLGSKAGVAAVAAGVAKRLRDRNIPGATRGELMRAEGILILMQSTKEKGRGRYKRAIAAFHAAMDGISPVTSPFDWVSLRTSDAGMLAAVGDEEGPVYLRQALAERQQVLAFNSKNRAPLDWGLAERDYAAAQARLADALGDSGMQSAAVDSYRAALDAFTENTTPLDWADTQSEIGSALRGLSYQTNTADPLDPALDALHLALKERTRARAPEDWASTESEIATVERMKAEFGNDPAAYTAAIAADRDVLTVYTREESPMAWAGGELELGNVLGDRGKLTKNEKDFTDAIDAYKAALSNYGPETFPSDYAVTLYDLGITYRAYANMKHDPALMKEAIATLKEAIAVYGKYGFTGGVNDSQSVLNGATADLAQMGPAGK